jgi:hypothetical protein
VSDDIKSILEEIEMKIREAKELADELRRSKTRKKDWRRMKNELQN